jgi:hypothetical protein
VRPQLLICNFLDQPVVFMPPDACVRRNWRHVVRLRCGEALAQPDA